MSEAERTFPILLSDREARALAAGWRLDVPWSLLEPHGRQARLNHYQSLERLAERGGLSVTEMLAVLQDRPWRPMDLRQALAELRALVDADSGPDPLSGSREQPAGAGAREARG